MVIIRKKGVTWHDEYDCLNHRSSLPSTLARSITAIQYVLSLVPQFLVVVISRRLRAAKVLFTWRNQIQGPIEEASTC